MGIADTRGFTPDYDGKGNYEATNNPLVGPEFNKLLDRAVSGHLTPPLSDVDPALEHSYGEPFVLPESPALALTTSSDVNDANERSTHRANSPMQLDSETETDGTRFPASPSPETTYIPDLTTKKLQCIPELQNLWDEYVDGYDTPGATIEAQLVRAQALVLPLLQHYFPAIQCFSVEPYSFDVMAKYGWSVKQVKARCSKEKSPPLHRWIMPEHIAGFVVHKTYSVDDEDGTPSAQEFPHTYFAVMADEPEHAIWLEHEDDKEPVKHGDIMSYSLGMHAKLQMGYAVLMIGSRLELYSFDNARDQEMKHYTTQHWGFDMKDTPLATINRHLEAVFTSDILYQNGVRGEGSRLTFPAARY